MPEYIVPPKKGRCSTCKWWSGLWDGYGECMKTEYEYHPDTIAWVVGSILKTKPDFGCVQWEQQDA